MNPRLFIKNIIAGLLYYSCLLNMLSIKKLSGRGFVLMYHRIVRSREQYKNLIQPGMFVAEETFEKHIAFLKKKFSIITLDEMVRRIDRGQSVNRCCSITFDDGWKDTYEAAFPILKKYQVPASIFLATGYIGTDKWFWPEELNRCLRMLFDMRSNHLETGNILKQLNIDLHENKGKNRTELINDVIERVKGYHPDQRELLMKRLRGIFPDSSRERLLMNWDEVSQMHESGLASFGAHTVNHVYLDQMEAEAIRYEICLSKQMIENHLGVPATLFAYPNGNYTASNIAMLEQNNILGAVTTRRGYVDKNTPLLEMPRIAMHDDVSRTIPLFFSRLLFSFF
ncbi:MAG: polysaccharide deacetylase family protein [Desulfomonilia bacterium]|jgi:peptidoglycan/xylan/chitin deacetylase (PgdA/CDA1 family)|nr:polysaccharide deacetylase family protein [Desulfomonilia bacterium]